MIVCNCRDSEWMGPCYVHGIHGEARQGMDMKELAEGLLTGKPTEFDHREVLHYWDDFSKREQYACYRLVAEMIKGHTYMTGEDKAREALQGLRGKGIGMHEKIQLKFTVKFVMNDLLALVGTMRRHRKKNDLPQV